MLGIFDDGPAFRVYDTQGSLVHPPDAKASDQMARLSKAGVDFHLDAGDDVALVQFKAQRPQDSRGEFYHLEVQAEDPTTMATSTAEALERLRSEGWETHREDSLISVVDEIPSLGEAEVDELTARAVQRVAQDDKVAFRVRSAKAGMELVKRLSRNGQHPPSVTLTDNPNFAPGAGLVLHPGGNGGIQIARTSDQRRVGKAKQAIRGELEAEFEGELRGRLAQALHDRRGPQRLQAIAQLNALMHGEAYEEAVVGGTLEPVVEVLDRAEAVSPQMRAGLETKGREVLEAELKDHVGEADGVAWWWIIIGFVIGIGVGLGLWWSWTAWEWSVSSPIL